MSEALDLGKPTETLYEVDYKTLKKLTSTKLKVDTVIDILGSLGLQFDDTFQVPKSIVPFVKEIKTN